MRLVLGRAPRRLAAFARKQRDGFLTKPLAHSWPVLRSCFHRSLRIAYPRGLLRRVNGTDTVRVDPALYFWPDEYEPEVWRHIIGEIHSDDTIVEVGASVGLYTVAMGRRVEPPGKVLAFEPDPESFRLLQRHMELNGVAGVVEVLQTALGNESGTVNFIGGSGTTSRIAHNGETASTTCQIRRLDEVVGGRSVDLLKLDVEGFELEVLRGAERLLRDPGRRPRAIFVEVHPAAWPGLGVDADAIPLFLGRCGYEVRYLDGRECSVIDAYGEVVARPHSDSNYTNVPH